MPKFNLRDTVRRKGGGDIRTVEEIRQDKNGDWMYWIQLGSDFVTREWAKEDELEHADR